MIHHVSIPAREPERVAKVLVELMGGRYFPFGPIEGAFLASSGDTHGTLIEVYPEHLTLNMPDPNGPVAYGQNQPVLFGKYEVVPQAWPFHVHLSTALSTEQVEQIGAREGWRAVVIARGRKGHKPAFHVIEFWVENRLMFELAPTAMVDEYKGFVDGEMQALYSDPEERRLSHATHVQASA